MVTLYFVYLLVSWWTFGFLPPLPVANSAAMNIHEQIVWILVFNSFPNVGEGLLGPRVSMFNFLRNCQNFSTVIEQYASWSQITVEENSEKSKCDQFWPLSICQVSVVLIKWQWIKDFTFLHLNVICQGKIHNVLKWLQII